MSDTLHMWTIYDHPTDHPDHYVVRRWTTDGPTGDCTLHDTLESARDSVPVGLCRFPRDPSDDPVIVETWL